MQPAYDCAMIVRPRRSVLYIPGSNPRALEKGKHVAADALIFDLEDSVAPADKSGARLSVLQAIRAGSLGDREIIVRINGLGTDWGRDDLKEVARSAADAVLLPKVSSPGDIMFAASDLAKAGAPDAMRLWAMVETPDAILNASALARTAADPASRLAVLVMGTNDLAKDTRVRQRPDRAPLAAWLSISVAAARSQNLDIIDGVFNGLDDPHGLRAECEQGRDFGMDGKTCVHPSQIDVCNDVFRPQPDEIEWARKVVAAFAEAGSGSRSVLRIEGRMVERLHLLAAERTLLIDQAIDARCLAA